MNLIRAVAARAGRDPNFSSVSLLLHADGSNGSTTITDHAGSPNTMTVHGSTALATATARFGSASLNQTSNGSYLSCTNGSQFNIRGGDFTLEASIYIHANSDVNSGGVRNATIMSAGYDDAGTNQDQWAFTVTGDATNTGTGLLFVCFDNTTQKITSCNYTFSKDVWYDVACVRNSSGILFYVNAASQTNAADGVGTSTYGTLRTAQPFRVGSQRNNTFTNYFKGNLDEIRVTKGVARTIKAITREFPNG